MKRADIADISLDTTQNEIQKQNHTYHTDILIIGAGPVGLFAIFQAGMLGMKCHVIDSLPHIGGQCSALYPTKPIYDIPGHPEISGQALIDHLHKQALPFTPQFHLGDAAQTIEQIKNPETQQHQLWKISTRNQTTIMAKSIFIACGPGMFQPKKPPLEHLHHFENQSVFYSVPDPSLFKDKTIVIAGGGDSAVDWANILADDAKHIYFIHRRAKMRAADDSVAQLKQKEEKGQISFKIPYQLDALQGDKESGRLDQVIIKDFHGQTESLDADILLPFFGLGNDLGPLLTWDLDMEKGTIKTNPTTSETNLPFIYAIGDASTYEHKRKLILTGFSEAAFAAYHVYDFIHDGKALHFQYSTSKGIPETVENT
jgi:thioredoxin reductase (NADPH)